MKNVSRVPAYFGGKKGWTIIGSDGKEIYEARLFCGKLIKSHHSMRTVDTYTMGVTKFFNYLIEAAKHLDGRLPTELELIEIIESWDDYLVFGSDSENSWVKLVSQSMPKGQRVKAGSSATWHQGLKRFLQESESYRKKVLELKELGLLTGIEVSDHKLFPDMGIKREFTAKEKSALIRNDIVASVIKGGPRLANVNFFPKIKYHKKKQHDQLLHFPFEKIAELIENSSSLRNKCLYALLAASGGRISEVMQVRRKDIDFENSLVYLTDHREYLGDDDELILTAEQWQKISYKAREHRETFLLAPYVRIFFDALQEYWDSIPYSNEHDFIFCAETISEWAKPLFLCNYSAIYKAFVSCADNVLGPGHGFSPHSLRHSYGFYMVNYCPNLDGGYGLSLRTVQEYMGHADLASTARYAVADLKLRRIEHEIANRIIYESGAMTENEVRLMVLEAQLQKQKSLVEKEKRLALESIKNDNS